MGLLSLCGDAVRVLYSSSRLGSAIYLKIIRILLDHVQKKNNKQTQTSKKQKIQSKNSQETTWQNRNVNTKVEWMRFPNLIV